MIVEKKRLFEEMWTDGFTSTSLYIMKSLRGKVFSEYGMIGSKGFLYVDTMGYAPHCDIITPISALASVNNLSEDRPEQEA